jgi:hypothetical protein
LLFITQEAAVDLLRAVIGVSLAYFDSYAWLLAKKAVERSLDE